MSTQQQEVAQAARLNVKLAPEIKPQHSERILSSTPGVISVIQTFPDEADEELSRMFVVEVDPSKLQGTLRKLQENPAVEYAEPTAPRKLIW